MGKTAIEWTDYSWNPIRARNRATGKGGWFCAHVSEGCRNCYAETINARLGTGVDYKAQNAAQVEILLDNNVLLEPLRWRKPRAIFVCSMTDLFGEFVRDQQIDRVFAVMALNPRHNFIVLSKRASRMRSYVADAQHRVSSACGAGNLRREELEARLGWPLPNVWLGVSVEDQANANARIPDLLATPARVRFISAEPLLGRIDLAPFQALDWVIVGGESGSRARPMHPDWARAIRDQCAAAGVAFFFKQWGEYAPLHSYRDDPWPVHRVGKRAAGRLLDGVDHNARPALREASAN